MWICHLFSTRKESRMRLRTVTHNEPNDTIIGSAQTLQASVREGTYCTCVQEQMRVSHSAHVKDNPGCQSSPSILFETGLLCCSVLHMPGQLEPGLPASSIIGMLGITDVCYHSQLYVDSGDVNSSTDASTLFTEQALQPQDCFKQYIILEVCPQSRLIQGYSYQNTDQNQMSYKKETFCGGLPFYSIPTALITSNLSQSTNLPDSFQILHSGLDSQDSQQLQVSTTLFLCLLSLSLLLLVTESLFLVGNQVVHLLAQHYRSQPGFLLL